VNTYINGVKITENIRQGNLESEAWAVARWRDGLCHSVAN